MSDIVGLSDPQEVKRQRKKYVAIMRAQFRLEQRLESIDYEFDVLQPKLREFENHIVTLGELPEAKLVKEAKK